VTCDVTERPPDNQTFRCTKGKQYWRNGVLDFGYAPPDKMNHEGELIYDCQYRTIFGPSVAHNGSIYAKNDINTSLMLQRITGQRPVLHDELFENQADYFDENFSFILWLREQFSPKLEDFFDVVDECRDHVGDPHPKRLLRLQAWQELIEEGRMYEPVWIHKVVYKMKRDEWAKYRGIPRGIGDLSVVASLQGFVLTGMLKEAQCRELHFFGGTAVFVKSPDFNSLTSLFNNLINPPGRFYFGYFSDDACLSIRHNGAVYLFNMDISKCDASHGPAVFRGFIDLVPEPARSTAESLVDQCRLPIEVTSTIDKRKKVKLKPNRPVLYSGSTMTTAINNLANLMICHSVVQVFDGTLESIKRGAQAVGYLVSGTEACEDFHDIQFLKHSPVLDSKGDVVPLLNLGVLLRASGVCRGDLPGPSTIPIQEKARIFQSALLAGAYPRAHFPLIDNMKKACAGATAQGKHLVQLKRQIETQFAYKVVDVDHPTIHVSAEESLFRYRLTPCEQYEVNELFGRAKFQDRFRTPGIEKILLRDYSLSCSVED